eukprot:7766649-Ditylum_brightwellii.AAC.1
MSLTSEESLVWLNEERISRALKVVLEESGDVNAPYLCVTISPSNFYVSVYKGMSLTNGYVKESGEDFCTYMREYHDGELMWHIKRTLES